MEILKWLPLAFGFLFLLCMVVSTFGETVEDTKKKQSTWQSIGAETEDVKNRKKRTMWDDDSIWKDDIDYDPAAHSIGGNIYYRSDD